MPRILKPRQHRRRQTDFEIISEWVEPRASVLDLGCGRGILLEHLRQSRGVRGLGVDIDPENVLQCVRRGVPVYQGDIGRVMAEFGPGSWDHVVISRTIEEVVNARATLLEALRIGRHVTVGFINRGYFLNRWTLLLSGSRTLNDVYPRAWYDSRPSNPISIREFERFCHTQGIHIDRVRHLDGDWRTSCRIWPNLRAGYAVYQISQPANTEPTSPQQLPLG